MKTFCISFSNGEPRVLAVKTTSLSKARQAAKEIGAQTGRRPSEVFEADPARHQAWLKDTREMSGPVKTAKQINDPQTGQCSFTPSKKEARLTYERISEIGIEATVESWCGNAGHAIGRRGADEVITELMEQRGEMIAALEYVFERLNDATEGGILPNSPFYPSWRMVRAAIAKARGEKS